MNKDYLSCVISQRHMSHEIRDEISNNVLHFFRQIFHRLLANVVGNAPSGFGYTAYYSSKCVGIGTEGNGSTNGILKRCALADNPESNRNSALACLVESVLYIHLIYINIIAGILHCGRYIATLAALELPTISPIIAPNIMLFLYLFFLKKHFLLSSFPHRILYNLLYSYLFLYQTYPSSQHIHSISKETDYYS